jgi:arylsulfatase
MARNVLFLMADQFRWDLMGSAFTPNLNALAARGLTMSQTYTSTPSCTPARSALLTGLSPWYNGMLGYGEIAPAYPYEMPRTMAETHLAAVVGKNHYMNSGVMPNASSPPPSHGWEMQWLYDGLGSGMDAGKADGGEFDDYDAWFEAVSGGQNPEATGGSNMDWNSWRGAPFVYEESWHPTAWTGRLAREFLTNYSSAGGDAAQPFFLKVSFHRPHSPYDPPARILNATTPAELPPTHVGGNWDTKFANSAFCGPSDPDAWCGAMPASEWEVTRRAYRASVRFVDEQLGAIVATLNSTGLGDDTWILFISDHGDGQGDHNLWRKCHPYELSSHIPGLIVWPSSVAAKVARGSTSPLLGELRDIFPTVLDIAGRAPARPLNGSSWACLVTTDPTGRECGSSASGGGWRTHLDLEHSTIFNETLHWNALIGGSIKYIFNAFEATEQLFDLAVDPNEMTDVSGDPAYAATLAQWRALLVAQFEAEGRGAEWVGPEGQLLARPKGQVYSPNYPKGGV